MKPQTGSQLSGKLLGVFALVGAGYLLGQTDMGLEHASADVRQTQRREAFEAGDQQSVVVLKQISKTLTGMDARIARIEKAITSSPKPDDR